MSRSPNRPQGRLESTPEAPRKRTSLKDLAAYLDLSQTTVSFALNDAPLAKNLTEQTRQRVLAAARKFNYRPSYFAVNLNKRGSDSVGVIVPGHSEGFFTVVMGGVEKYLLSKHYVYFTACHYWKPKLIEEYSRLLIDRGAEGLLLLNTNADFATLSTPTSTRTPSTSSNTRTPCAARL